jgi:imidazolonepropionase-like amidohydrolase
MRNASILIGLALVFAGTALASDQIPAPAQAGPIALTGATIYPVSGPPIAGGTIVFDKGKITAVGRDAAIPSGATRIDVPGKRIYPGLFSAYTQIGLTEVGSVRGTNDLSETGRINPNVRVEASVNPGSEIIPVTRANGIALALVAPSGGTISGRSAVMMMDGWTWEDMVLKAPAALHVNWPSMTTVRAWWMRQSDEEQRKEREKSQEALKSAFDDARAYAAARSAAGAKGVPLQPSDLRWEAMVPVFGGDLPVIVGADEIQQIEAAVAWADREKLKLIIWGGADAWRVADLLKARDIPVIVSGTHRTPSRRFDDYDDPFSLPAKLRAAGIRFCIAGGGASNERNLPYQAATAAAYGLPADDALKSITLYPAQILGVADRVGSLEPGKDATLIVTDGDPLEIPTQVERMFIQGRDVDLTSRHTMLYEKYKTKYSRMKR